MSPFAIRLRALFTFAAFASLALPQPQAVLGQSAPKFPSAQQIAKPPDPVDQEQFLPYWTTETGWQCELQLRNNLAKADLTVTPALRTADGTETALGAVTIKPNEVQAIDLDAAIAATGAPQLVGAYGSVVLRYHSPSHRNLYAALMVRAIGHSIAFHIDAIGESQGYQAGSREGVWWLPTETANDYLILTNQGRNTIPLDLSLYDARGKQSAQKLLLGPRETMRYSVRKLISAAGLMGSFGGIKISATAHAGSLDTLHFLFDAKATFSALLKMFGHDQNSKLEERDYANTKVWTLRAPMLALSNPDPALAFPRGTVLQPQLFIRNTTAGPVDTALRFNWRSDGGAGNVVGPTLHLSPFETRRVDVAALQSNGLFPKEANWTSVTLTTNTAPDEVMAVATSYDESLKFGAQTPFSDQLSFQWEGGMWEYDAQRNSIITVGNGGTKPTRAAFTILYNQGMQKYELEQTLQPDEQMWVDVGRLIRERVPDKNGTVLPLDLAMGAYEIRDLTDAGTGTLFEGKVIYDKTYGHVTYGCSVCCAYGIDNYDYAYPSNNPLIMAVGGCAINGVYADNVCTGNQDDVSARFYHWVSTDTSIATTTSAGNFTGRSAGSTTGSTQGNLFFADRQGLCPTRNVPVSANVTVTPPPDHLVVVVDQQGASANCPSTGVQLRLMQMRVVDVNGNTVPDSPAVVEAINPLPVANSCNNGSPVPSFCESTASDGTFIDSMSVSGNLCNSGISRSSGCGFTATSTWSACANSGRNTLWVSPRTVLSNNVTVDGNPGSFSAGTICNSTGCH